MDRGHLQWLAGVLGLYSTSLPPDPEFVEAALPSLSLLRYPEGAVILRQGDPGEDLFIIYSGKAHVFSGDKRVAELGPAALLGEIGYLTHKPRSATVRAATVCDAFRIRSFGKFLADYPELRSFMKEIAERRLSELQQLGQLSARGPARPPAPAPAEPVPPKGAPPRKPEPSGFLSAPAAPPGPRPASGRLGGRYEPGRLIGQGGMGEVLLGHDHLLDRPVAIKKLRDEISSYPAFREQFLQEARIVAKLTHPFIVGIHDIIDEPSGMYLVFDYIEGSPISKLIEDKHVFTLKECRTVFHFVCQAVAHAHWNRVLHRDLKPANIMIERNGYAKVMDFGIARTVKESLGRLTQLETSGTPVFMAPEQHLGKCTPASDVYSLGVCLYQMLTGEIPFPGPDFYGQKERMLFAPATSRVPALPRELDRFFSTALAAEPSKRFPDPMPFLAALRALCPG